MDALHERLKLIWWAWSGWPHSSKVEANGANRPRRRLIVSYRLDMFVTSDKIPPVNSALKVRMNHFLG